ncbi:hypothetical protein PDESU_03835 [Pontiella desulfatans]|uniref:Uncharacterized protein n=1 Tax=Pontiella desulfatans TaxID=2750659 RepID=A0A6C2U5T8_PONDE|nr:hypothetical protein [Pontiella desulfatans]VGO15253.1 hypothetical protein PDESU_03835 [Pontiella desulfatans]
MTHPPSNRGLLWAALVGVAAHLLLFVVLSPAGRNGIGGVRVPPQTGYMMQLDKSFPLTETQIRTVKSPVVFSLPSGMGFSRELFLNDVVTPLNTLSRPEQSESFLEVDPVSQVPDHRLVPQGLMLAGDGGEPSLPVDVFVAPEAQPAARRVTIAPELKERLEGGIVLPASLNLEVQKAWEARASVSVSEAGSVQHVFLERPLESASLNRQVLLLLYGLHFKPGESIEGSIEIYSPETSAKPETAAKEKEGK